MKKYILLMLFLFCSCLTHATEFVQQSEFDKQQLEIKYSLLASSISDQQLEDSEDIVYSGSSPQTKNADYKSPGKAFAMSLLLPGWGQHYTGASKLKSLAFLGAEVTSWVLYFKWEKDADNLTADYEAFNNAHWIEERYDSMIVWTYNTLPDGTPTPEISHHLPDTKTQQYYEMTGKYDQFSWGWDDAVHLTDGRTYEDYSAADPFDQVIGNGVPYSDRRVQYEIMRDDANNKYDQARKMIYVSMLNRLFSAFEAMIAAKKSNSNSSNNTVLSALSLESSFKSIYVKRDTPYLTLKMKF